MINLKKEPLAIQLAVEIRGITKRDMHFDEVVPGQRYPEYPDLDFHADGGFILSLDNEVQEYITLDGSRLYVMEWEGVRWAWAVRPDPALVQYTKTHVLPQYRDRWLRYREHTPHLAGNNGLKKENLAPTTLMVI